MSFIDVAKEDDRWWRAIRATDLPPRYIAEAIAGHNWPENLPIMPSVTDGDLIQTLEHVGEYYRDNPNGVGGEDVDF